MAGGRVYGGNGSSSLGVLLQTPKSQPPPLDSLFLSGSGIFPFVSRESFQVVNFDIRCVEIRQRGRGEGGSGLQLQDGCEWILREAHTRSSFADFKSVTFSV